ncbi:hypothetical protein [Kocuria turfanensis]|uniref:Uncharacterized protein n=1 Tax=Kocuria turfanensis TaxID=388357 RepID=A0A512IGH5_9MICC|nr:hypothetical protein [Kocuria turfanensis]GEO96805.1 hypothetical protein KTU01_29280 [Kocuria turfanensis]
MVQLPGVLVLYGCLVVAASVATSAWSLVQAGLHLSGPGRRRAPGARAAAAAHLDRAAAGAGLAAATAALPLALGHARTLGALLSAF